MGVAIQVYTVDNDHDMPYIWERYIGSPPIRGAAGNGRGYTMHGLLLSHTQIRMTVFRCPADKRDYELREENFWQLDYSQGDQWQNILFDYSANAVGWGMSTRRIPWTIPDWKGPLQQSKIE